MGRTLNPEERRRSAAMLDDITSLHTDICRRRIHVTTSLAPHLACDLADDRYRPPPAPARHILKLDTHRAPDQHRADISTERRLPAANGDGNPRTHVYVYVDLLSLLRL